MTRSRLSQFGARLGLLAMLLLFVAPLFSQGLSSAAPAQQSGLPGWLNELSCRSQSAGQPQAPEHHTPWAKCGYCTLLLGSPALPSVSTVVSALPATVDVTLLARASSIALQARVFPTARPRAPPLFLS